MTNQRMLAVASLFAAVALAACGAPDVSSPDTRALPEADAPILTVSIEGQLCNRHTGQLLVGATINVVDEAEVVTTSVTDDAGAYALDGLASGRLIVTQQAPGFQKTLVFDTNPGDVVIASNADGCD